MSGYYNEEIKMISTEPVLLTLLSALKMLLTVEIWKLTFRTSSESLGNLKGENLYWSSAIIKLFAVHSNFTCNSEIHDFYESSCFFSVLSVHT